MLQHVGCYNNTIRNNVEFFALKCCESLTRTFSYDESLQPFTISGIFFFSIFLFIGFTIFPTTDRVWHSQSSASQWYWKEMEKTRTRAWIQKNINRRYWEWKRFLQWTLLWSSVAMVAKRGTTRRYCWEVSYSFNKYWTSILGWQINWYVDPTTKTKTCN